MTNDNDPKSLTVITSDCMVSRTHTPTILIICI